MPEGELTDLREHVKRDRPLGAVAWMQRIAARQGLEQTLRERGRPRKPLDSLSARQRRRRMKEEDFGQNGA